MTAPEFIDERRFREALSMTDAIAALEEMFAAEPPLTPPRSILDHNGDQLLLMPSWGEEAAGVKLITAAPSNPAAGLPLINGVYVLFSGDTLEPVAIFDAAPLTAVRTAAVSAVATKHLARADASHLVVFGAGVQGKAHIEAMRAVRDIERVTVVTLTEATGRSLVAELEGVDASLGTAEDVIAADIICTCTTARRPLFDGNSLPVGCHVNAVGTHQPDAREVDGVAIGRAKVVVETRQAALSEAGEIAIPIAEGAAPEDVVAGDLSEVVKGLIGRSGKDEITVFKSVGVASEDLAVALAAAKVLVERLRPQ